MHGKRRLRQSGERRAESRGQRAELGGRIFTEYARQRGLPSPARAGEGPGGEGSWNRIDVRTSP